MPDDPSPQQPINALIPTGAVCQDLLPIAPIIDSLSEASKQDDARFQVAMVVLGPAASGCMTCPGNQLDVPDHEKCPFASKCTMLRDRVAPAGHLCPIEARFIVKAFESWCAEVNKTPSTLTATERSFVQEMVWLDLQEQRCAAIVSHGKEGRLTHDNPKEVQEETGQILSWERVIHVNVQLLNQIWLQRKMWLKDMLLTPEMKAKAAKWTGQGATGKDLTSTQSARAARLRSLTINADE